MRDRHSILLWSALLVSGAAGLIYQVVWMRLLLLFLGVTSQAVSTVLATFMAGLCLGSWLLARRADKVESPLKFYAYLEIGIAVFGVLSVPLLGLLQSVYVSLVRELALSQLFVPYLRVLCASIALLIPTTLMGATLPALIRALCSANHEMGKQSGILYGINTLGAVLGTIVCAYYLIENFGLSGAVWCGAICNIVAACLTLVVSNFLPNSAGMQPAGAKTLHVSDMSSAAPVYSSGMLRLVMIAFALSGLFALCYEVLWTRYLIFVLGTNSVYAFSAILTCFLFGIMLGSIIVSRYCDGLERPVGVFGVVLGLVGASAICVMALSSALFGPLTALDPRVAGMLQFVLLLLVPTTFSGMTFALVAKVYARSPKRFANDTGLLYALNTLGSIFGAVLGGFVILPLVGAQQGIVLVALLNVIVGVVILMRERPRWLTSLRLITAAVVFVLLAIPAFRADQIALASLMDKNDQLLFFRDGSESSIGVVEIPSDGDRYILVDGDQQAVTTVSGHFSLRLLGHLPPLFSRERSKGLIIAFGTGVTVANLLQHNLQQLDIVELSPIVIDVADYFSEWNKNALRDPRVRVIRDDGRNHLLTTESSYDVISVDPIDPDDAGVTSLYSHEFYELVHARLNPGGVAAQWIPTVYSAADFKMLLRTFQAVFPQSSLWIADFTVVLIGVKGEGKPDWTEMQQLFSRGQVEESFNRVGIDSLETLFAHQLLGPTELANYLGPGPLNTDQFPRIEYSGPRNFRFNNWPLVHLPPMHAEGSPDISQWVSGITDLGRVQQVQADMREVLTHYERRSFPWQSGDWEKVGAIHVGAVAGFDNYQNGLRSLYQMLLKQTSGAVLLQMELLSSRGPTPRYAYWREQIAALLAVGPNSDLVCAPQIGRSLVDDFYQLAYCDLIDQPLSSLEHLLQSQLARKYRESVTWFARMMLLRALDLSQQHGSYEQDRERLNALLPAELSLPVDLDRASEGLKQSLQRLVVKDMKIELL